MSVTVTEKPQLFVLPDPSVAVQLTVVLPFANIPPDAGVQTSDGFEHKSLAVTV